VVVSTETQAATPTRAELVRRAQDLVPLIKEKASWTEENRRLHPEVVEAIGAAGLFKLRVPARHGGAEADTTTLVDVATQLGSADGSTSWVTSVYWIPSWMTGLFPEHVQEEVFSTPDVRIAGTLAPSATAVPTAGGITVNGQWGFVSGALHANWQEIIAVLMTEPEPYPVLALVPISDLTVHDDWHTTGLQGTGSVTTTATDLFVPADRVLPLPVVLNGQPTSPQAGAISNAPLLPVAAASSVGTALGLAKGAREHFLSSLPNRKITYTDYASQAQAPLTHHQLADATLALDAAIFHAHRLAGDVDSRATGPGAAASWTLEERVRARADLGAACRLAKQSVDTIASASGGSSIFATHPVQRIARDINALTLHALMHPDTNSELYGRILADQPPNTLYL
jgi:alkylation response protein AidB-like acyl-CoA dehydrogenase